MDTEQQKKENIPDFERLLGSYKLSCRLLLHILAKEVTGPDGKQYPSLSKCEIITLLYFTQIADSASYIAHVKINELGSQLGYSKRHAYNIIQNLKKKGFIDVTGDGWTGYYSVIIKDNDFQQVKKYTSQNRYLNTNHPFLCSDTEYYFTFINLSLYAVKTFLYIFYGYDALYGYRFSLERLMAVLGINDKYLCISYLKELEAVLGKGYYTLRGSKTKRLKYDIVEIHSGNAALVPDQGIRQNQASYYKHKWLIYLKKTGLQFKRDRWLVSEIFGIVYTCLRTGRLLLGAIENIIKEALWIQQDEEHAILGIKYGLALAESELKTGT